MVSMACISPLSLRENLGSPPHFGAWTLGNLGNNPANVAFFPNVMHAVEGIALNASIWALHRAEWANHTLSSLGVQPLAGIV
jgi:hypothetical protein